MIVELPEHVAEGDSWREWPRSLDAHLKYGVRRRQVEAYTRNGKLTVYSCPDGTKRLDPDALRELFGEPGVIQGRDRDLSAADRKAKQEQRQLESGAMDPTMFMFGRSVEMQQALHAQLIGQLKLISEPMQVLMSAHREMIAAQATRIRELEKQADESALLRAELADAKQEREIALNQYHARERRRDETLRLLKEQVPALFAQWLTNDSVSGFAKRVPREALEVLIETGMLSEQDADVIRRSAGIPKPPPPSPTNGAAHA